MARNPIFKVNGRWCFSRGVDPYIVKSAEELDEIPESKDAQFALIVGDGSGAKKKLRLPGEEWTEV